MGKNDKIKGADATFGLTEKELGLQQWLVSRGLGW